MNKNIIKEFYAIVGMLSVSNDALRFLNNRHSLSCEYIVSQNHEIYRKLLAFGINYIGDSENCDELGNAC